MIGNFNRINNSAWWLYFNKKGSRVDNIKSYANKLSPEMYQRIKTSVETGRWLDGKKLTDRQKQESLQLLLAYQSIHNCDPEHFTIDQTGEIFMQKKSILKAQFADKDKVDSKTDTYQIDLW